MNLTLGVAAHVDAGKTTLCEQLLRRAGVIRACGRVDHGDAFMDDAETLSALDAHAEDTAFQQRFRQTLVDGIPDGETRAILFTLQVLEDQRLQAAAGDDAL